MAILSKFVSRCFACGTFSVLGKRNKELLRIVPSIVCREGVASPGNAITTRYADTAYTSLLEWFDTGMAVAPGVFC